MDNEVKEDLADVLYFFIDLLKGAIIILGLVFALYLAVRADADLRRKADLPQETICYD